MLQEESPQIRMTYVRHLPYEVLANSGNICSGHKLRNAAYSVNACRSICVHGGKRLYIFMCISMYMKLRSVCLVGKQCIAVQC